MLRLLVIPYFIMVAEAAFDMSESSKHQGAVSIRKTVLPVFPRQEMKVCRGERLSLECPRGDLLWVHEAISGVTLFAIKAHFGSLCLADSKDCRKDFSETDDVFRATSCTPFYVTTNGMMMKCLLGIMTVDVSYILIHYSCIKDHLLNPVNMFSSTTMVANNVNIQLPLKQDYHGVPSEATCLIRPTYSRRSGMTVTVTLVYVDLPRSSSCSQKLWAENQDNVRLFSVCSPQWFRQRIIYEGDVNWVTLHFRSQTQPVRVKRAWINDPQTQAFLFIWMYIRASVTFTMTCNEPPTTALASPVSSTPLTERIPWAGDRTTTNPPVRTPPHLTRPSSRPGNPVSTVSSQQHVEPVATTPTPRPSSSITPSSATQTHTEQDLSTELPLDGVLTTLEADPNTPGNAMLGDGAHTVVDRPWKIGGC